MPLKERKESLLDPRIFQHQNVVFYGEDNNQVALGAQPAMCEESPNSWNIVWEHCNPVEGAIMYISGNYEYQSGILRPGKNGSMNHLPVGPHLLNIQLQSRSFELPADNPAMFIYRPNAQDLSIFITPNVLKYDQSIFQRMVRKMSSIDSHIQRIAHDDKKLSSLGLSRHQAIMEKAFRLEADQRGNNYWGHKGY